MSKLIIAAFVLTVGCGGEPFAPGFNSSPGVETDGGSDAAGGASTVESDSSTGGKFEHGHGGAGTGGARETGSGGASTGGTRGSGGSSSGGADSAGGTLSAAGGAGTGGTSSTGGSGSGGVPQEMDGGCALVTHDNGLGQTWQDCVPLGTYNETQAMKACEASGAPNCRLSGCTADTHSMVCGIDASGSFAYGGCWGYTDLSAGHVVPAASAGGCPITTGSWR